MQLTTLYKVDNKKVFIWKQIYNNFMLISAKMFNVFICLPCFFTNLLKTHKWSFGLIMFLNVYYYETQASLMCKSFYSKPCKDTNKMFIYLICIVRVVFEENQLKICT